MIRWCEQPRIINTISYYHVFSIAYSYRLQAADKGFSYTLFLSFRSKGNRGDLTLFVIRLRLQAETRILSLANNSIYASIYAYACLRYLQFSEILRLLLF